MCSLSTIVVTKFSNRRGSPMRMSSSAGCAQSDACPATPRSQGCCGISEQRTGKTRSARRSSSATPCEEIPAEFYDAAVGLPPVFVFHEGDGLAIYFDQHGGHPPQKVEQVFRELARLSGGAYGKFDAGAAKQLGDLLRAVAAFAVGGVAALANQQTDSARKLLGQMK